MSLIHHTDRRGRITIVERDAIAQEAEEIEKRKQETAERKKQSHDLVAESIRRELLESVFLYILSRLLYSYTSKRKRRNRYLMLTILTVWIPPVSSRLGDFGSLAESRRRRRKNLSVKRKGRRLNGDVPFRKSND